MNVLIQGWSNEDESMILFDGSMEDYRFWFKNILSEPTEWGAAVSQSDMAGIYRDKMFYLDPRKMTPRALTQAASMEAILDIKFESIYSSTYNGEVRSDLLE